MLTSFSAKEATISCSISLRAISCCRALESMPFKSSLVIASNSVRFWSVIALRLVWLTLASLMVSVLYALEVTSMSLRLVAPSSFIFCTSVWCCRFIVKAAICCCISATIFWLAISCIWTCGGMSDFSSILANGFSAARRSAITSAPGKSMLRNTKSPAAWNNSGLAWSNGIMDSTASWRLDW